MAEFSQEDIDRMAKAIDSAFSRAAKTASSQIKRDLEGVDGGGNQIFGKIGQSIGKVIPAFDKFTKLLGVARGGFAAIAVAAGKAGMAADKEITKMAKAMTLTKDEAMGARFELLRMANASGDAFITGEKLVKSTAELQKQLGIAQMFSSDVTVEFTKLTEKMGIATDSAANLARLSIVNGDNFQNATESALGTAQALQSQAGIQLNNRDILESIGKVSGQLLSNFRGNVSAIASAITQAKLLGTTLEQTKKQSESLLDFESSISNELQAELITGQQLNLERARGAALLGDQETVMKELANQNMNFNKFSSMNVIAQKSMAQALGLTTDELANQLLQRQFINNSMQEVEALAGKEVAKRLEALTAQQKFDATVERLKDALVRIVDGPVGRFLDFVASFTYDTVGAGIQTLGPGMTTPSGGMVPNNPSTNTTVVSIDYDKLASSMSKVQLKPQVDVRDISERQIQTTRR